MLKKVSLLKKGTQKKLLKKVNSLKKILKQLLKTQKKFPLDQNNIYMILHSLAGAVVEINLVLV